MPRVLAVARWLAGQRLLQFAFFGGLIFAAAPRTERRDVIDITSQRLAALHAAETARGKGAATDQEVDQRELEDEILYREGVRLGLDRNDGIVRQRIVQKVLFLAEETAGAARPADDAALRAFFEQHREQWTVGESVSFDQIFRHQPEVLRSFVAAPPAGGEPPKGEPSPVAPHVDEDLAHLREHLGPAFAAAVSALPAEGSTWAGPVASAFGWHLVRVIEHRPPRPARFEDVKPAVAEAYGVFRRQEAVAAYLEAAFARYHVAVDGKPLTTFTPSRRVAFRTVTSGED